MMKIGILSDSHDRLEGLQKAVQIFKEQEVEMIIHCGDWVSPFTLKYFDSITENLRVPVKSIFGNNEGDFSRIYDVNAGLTNPVEFANNTTMSLEIEGKKVIVYHGQDPNLLKGLIDSQVYDVIFTGHTHTPRNEQIGKTLVFNPGSSSFIRGFQLMEKASVGVYDSETGKAELIEFA